MFTKRNKAFLFFFCFVLSNTFVFGQDTYPVLSSQKAITQYIVDIWKKDQGLAQNTVFSVLQSSDDYLWVATYNGLSQFDGLEFRNFNTQNTQKLKSNSISVLYQTQNDDLWIGTNGGGLNRLRKGYFQHFSYENGLASDNILSLLEDPNDQNILWIGTAHGLSYLEKNQEKFVNFETKDGLPNLRINDLLVDWEGVIWGASDKGLFRIENKKIIPVSEIDLPNLAVKTLCQTSDSLLWIGTENGLLAWNPKTQQQNNYAVHEGILGAYITKIMEDKDKNLWIGTKSAGLNRLVNGKFEVLNAHNGLTDNSIRSITQDKEGSIWVGLDRGGLNRLREGKFLNFTEKENLTNNFTNCVFEDDQNGIWIGTQNKGLSYYKDGKFTNYTSKDGLAHKHVRSITQDKQGFMWFGTYGGGISRFKEGKFENFTSKDGLKSDVIRQIFPDVNTGIWIATEEGLNRFKNGKINSQNTNNQSLTSIYQSQNGFVWLGSDGAGVEVLRQNELSYQYSTQDGLADNVIFSFFEDQNEAMWIGTEGGLSRIKDDEIFSFEPKDKQFGAAIYQIILDKGGEFWFSSNNGIFHANKAELDAYIDQEKDGLELPKITFYDESDGMLSSDCAFMAYPAGMLDSKGLLWFPTSKGVSSINPMDIKINTKAPKVGITKVLVDDQKWIPSHSKKRILEAGKSRFEFYFDALSFISAHKIKYRYKLEGFDKEWREEKGVNKVVYTNLKAGDYTFWVKAANSDGVWNEQGAKLPFVLKAHWHQTTIFYFILLSCIIGGGIVFYKIRTDRLTQAKDKLELAVEERTSELRKSQNFTTKQNKELLFFQQIVDIINQEVEPESVLNVLIEQGIALLGGYRGFFLLFDAETYHYELLSSFTNGKRTSHGQIFEFEQIINYCKPAQALGQHFYWVESRQDLHPFEEFPTAYSLVMSISEHEIPKALFVLDYDTNQAFNADDKQRMQRFKGLVKSAYEKAQAMILIEKKQATLEKTIDKLSSSIQYAKRIQNAILPNTEDIRACFENAFVMNVPKDIVSGDFYWFRKIDNLLIIAAIDCTGHGVPGAFMTLMANSALRQVVEERKIYDPAQILYHLDNEISKTFETSSQSNRRGDGMDMSLLAIDTQKQLVTFSGAKNPLCYVRNNEMFRIKGSKFPIGNADKYPKKIFETVRLPIEKGDIFYLYSDGFQDQFEQGTGAKFMSTNFRNFLLEYSYLDMKEQQEMLEKALHLWKGEGKQTDDILIIGLKF